MHANCCKEMGSGQLHTPAVIPTSFIMVWPLLWCLNKICFVNAFFRLHLLLQWLTNKPNVYSVTYNGLAMKLLLLKPSTQLQILNNFERNININSSES